MIIRRRSVDFPGIRSKSQTDQGSAKNNAGQKENSAKTEVVAPAVVVPGYVPAVANYGANYFYPYYAYYPGYVYPGLQLHAHLAGRLSGVWILPLLLRLLRQPLLSLGLCLWLRALHDLRHNGILHLLSGLSRASAGTRATVGRCTWAGREEEARSGSVSEDCS